MESNNLSQSSANSSAEPPDFYVARGANGYAIGIAKIKDRDGDYHVYTQDDGGHTTTDPYEKGMSETDANSAISEYLERLTKKGFAIEEYYYPQSQKVDTPDNTRRGGSEAPKNEDNKDASKIKNQEPINTNRANQETPQTESRNGVDWRTVAESAGSTILKSAGIAAAGAGLVAFGAVSAPFLVGAGLAFSVGMGINTFFLRANEAMDAGEDDYFGRAAAAGISDMVPVIDVVGIGEAATGFNYMTGQEMTQQERSEKLGGLIGGAAMDFAPTAGARVGLTNPAKEMAEKIKTTYKQSEFKKIIDTPPRGYAVVIPVGGNSRPTRLSKKIGVKAEDIVYSESAPMYIASDKLLKSIKKGQGTGMDSNHLLLAEWFRKGPAHLKGLEDYVPAVVLLGGIEHQGTFHGAFNELMRNEGLFKKSKYTQDDIERGMLIAENFFKTNPGGELGNSWADACKDFRINIFNQLKK
jgi:hypothetical protein